MEDTILQYIAQYGYVGIYLALMLGIIGIPIPDEVLMAFAGFLVSKGSFQYLYTLIIAFLGSITGMSVSFFVGRKLGLPFLVKYGKKVHITPEKLHKMEAWFHRFGKMTVTVGYFFPGFRHVTAYLAAISKWSFGTFLLYAIPGGFIWVATFLTLGVFLGQHWRAFTAVVYNSLWVVIALVAISLLAWQWWRRLSKVKAKNVNDD
ncbi:DedA family protein [Numidum massiliense]|uniref:DedA family protein n=1 Tax=Numidum massiliense TaxID=1522315 RepID=UPI00093F2852|nr:DedA family protein [Numidum massiliense]